MRDAAPTCSGGWSTPSRSRMTSITTGDALHPRVIQRRGLSRRWGATGAGRGAPQGSPRRTGRLVSGGAGGNGVMTSLRDAAEARSRWHARRYRSSSRLRRSDADVVGLRACPPRAMTRSRWRGRERLGEKPADRRARAYGQVANAGAGGRTHSALSRHDSPTLRSRRDSRRYEVGRALANPRGRLRAVDCLGST
jgi:hypothetical protein